MSRNCRFVFIDISVDDREMIAAGGNKNCLLIKRRFYGHKYNKKIIMYCQAQYNLESQ